MGGRVVSPVIRCPPRSTTSTSQLDGSSYFVRRPANGYNSVISKVCPDFVGVGEIERLARIPPEPFGLVDHLAFAQAHDDKTPVGLPCNKQALAFDVHRYVVHVAFGR